MQHNDDTKQRSRTDLATAARIWATSSGSSIHPEFWLVNQVVWQRCENCHQASYPFRALCPHCLSECMQWQFGTNSGKLKAMTNLHVSFSPLYQRESPWGTAYVLCDEGLGYFVFLNWESVARNEPVDLYSALDSTGELVTIAVQPGGMSFDAAGRIASKLALLANTPK